MSWLAGQLQGSFAKMWAYSEHDEAEEKSGAEESEKKE